MASAERARRPRGRGDLLLTRPLVFVGGKGGVGKTTVAAALAILLARRGERTLLVSTDPAHSTGDIFGAALDDSPRSVYEGVDAVEIDVARRAAAYIDRIKEEAASSVSRDVLPSVHRHLEAAKAAPGTEESALFDRFVDLMSTCPGEYDRIVFDTAPTGHTLRLLALPALLSVWIRGIVRQREKAAGVERMVRNLAGSGSVPEPDRVLDHLRDRQQRFHEARERLHHDSTFLVVLVPERLPIEETARTVTALSANDIAIGGLVVNRVLPEIDEGPFLAARIEQQRQHLGEIRTRFEGLALTEVLHDPRDVTSLEQLERIAEQLDAPG